MEPWYHTDNCFWPLSIIKLLFKVSSVHTGTWEVEIGSSLEAVWSASLEYGAVNHRRDAVSITVEGQDT